MHTYELSFYDETHKLVKMQPHFSITVECESMLQALYFAKSVRGINTGYNALTLDDNINIQIERIA